MTIFRGSTFSCAALVIGSVALAGGGMKQTTTMHNFADASVIDQAEAQLDRMEHGIAMTVKTNGLTPGDAVTMWWVVFNDPGACSSGECGEDDIFNLDPDGNFIENADGTAPMNMDGIEAAKISILRADGKIIDKGGAAEFRGHLPVGDTTEAVLGPGLLDPSGAEVHAVIRSHQQVKPGMSDMMVNSMNGGCDETWPNEPCEDLQFAVFKPSM